MKERKEGSGTSEVEELERASFISLLTDSEPGAVRAESGARVKGVCSPNLGKTGHRWSRAAKQVPIGEGEQRNEPRMPVVCRLAPGIDARTAGGCLLLLCLVHWSPLVARYERFHSLLPFPLCLPTTRAARRSFHALPVQVLRPRGGYSSLLFSFFTSVSTTPT